MWCRTKLFETVSITTIVRMFTALVQEQNIIVFANTVRTRATGQRGALGSSTLFPARTPAAPASPLTLLVTANLPLLLLLLLTIIMMESNNAGS
jgi:hypothetical protein